MATSKRYIVIDKDRLRFVKATPTYMQAEYWAALKCKNRDTYLCGPERRSFTVFSEMELSALCASAGHTPGPNVDYQSLVQLASGIADGMALDDTSEEVLAAKLGRSLEGLQEASTVGGHMQDAAPAKHHSAQLQADQTAATVPSRRSSTTPEEETMSTKKAKKAKKAASNGRDHKNGITRPKPGGNTAAVWEACDAVQAKLGKKRAPAFSEVDAKLGRAGIPQATRRAQYASWRKYNGITGRVVVE